MRCKREEITFMFSLKPNHLTPTRTIILSKDNYMLTRFRHQYG